MHPWWNFVTDFGDTAVTVPLAFAMACFLAATKHLRLALGWCLAIAGCAGAMAALKLAFVACGAPLIGPVLTSPSGHTAMGIAIYGGYAAILGTRLPSVARAALITAAVLFAIGIALSRIVLHDHSPLEVVVGLAVGSATLALLVAIVARFPPSPLPTGHLVGAAIVIALLFHGERWPAEQALRRLAGWFDLLRPWCS